MTDSPSRERTTEAMPPAGEGEDCKHGMTVCEECAYDRGYAAAARRSVAPEPTQDCFGETAHIFVEGHTHCRCKKIALHVAPEGATDREAVNSLLSAAANALIFASRNPLAKDQRAEMDAIGCRLRDLREAIDAARGSSPTHSEEGK